MKSNHKGVHSRPLPHIIGSRTNKMETIAIKQGKSLEWCTTNGALDARECSKFAARRGKNDDCDTNTPTKRKQNEFNSIISDN